MHAARHLARRTTLSTPTVSARPAYQFAPRTMASASTTNNSTSASAPAAAPLQEWMVIAPDFEGALEKRLAVRPDHIGGLKADREDFWLWGGMFPFPFLVFCLLVSFRPVVRSTQDELTNARPGAMLEEPIQAGSTAPPKMKGSAMLIGARTREEVVERLKRDVYVSGGVWDWEKVQIIPFKSALRKAL